MMANEKLIKGKIDNTFEEASKLLKDDKEKIINELNKLLEVAEGSQDNLKNIIKIIVTKIKL